MREELNASRARVAELEEKNRSSEELLKEGPTITQEVDLLHSKQLEVVELQKQLATVHAELELRRKNQHQTEQIRFAAELKALKERTAVQTLAEEPDILNAEAPSDPLPSASVKVKTPNDALQRAELKNTELCEAKEHARSANMERIQALEGSNSRLSREVLDLRESAETYTRTMIRITNIPMDYTQEDVIRQWLGNGKHLIHWDESPDMFMRLQENDTQSCIAYLANEQAALELKSRFEGFVIFGKKLRFEVETLKKTVEAEPNPGFTSTCWTVGTLFALHVAMGQPDTARTAMPRNRSGLLMQ
ncbi:unnamed protein product, partial [Mesorhabditis spiculigera]